MRWTCSALVLFAAAAVGAAAEAAPAPADARALPAEAARPLETVDGLVFAEVAAPPLKPEQTGSLRSEETPQPPPPQLPPQQLLSSYGGGSSGDGPGGILLCVAMVAVAGFLCCAKIADFFGCSNDFSEVCGCGNGGCVTRCLLACGFGGGGGGDYQRMGGIESRGYGYDGQAGYGGFGGGDAKVDSAVPNYQRMGGIESRGYGYDGQAGYGGFGGGDAKVDSAVPTGPVHIRGADFFELFAGQPQDSSANHYVSAAGQGSAISPDRQVIHLDRLPDGTFSLRGAHYGNWFVGYPCDSCNNHYVLAKGNGSKELDQIRTRWRITPVGNGRFYIQTCHDVMGKLFVGHMKDEHGNPFLLAKGAKSQEVDASRYFFTITPDYGGGYGGGGFAAPKLPSDGGFGGGGFAAPVFPSDGGGFGGGGKGMSAADGGQAVHKGGDYGGVYGGGGFATPKFPSDGGFGGGGFAAPAFPSDGGGFGGKGMSAADGGQAVHKGGGKMMPSGGFGGGGKGMAAAHGGQAVHKGGGKMMPSDGGW